MHFWSIEKEMHVQGIYIERPLLPPLPVEEDFALLAKQIPFAKEEAQASTSSVITTRLDFALPCVQPWELYLDNTAPNYDSSMPAVSLLEQKNNDRKRQHVYIL
jgi:hypothetical protein